MTKEEMLKLNISEVPAKELENLIKMYLDKCGLFYKCFSRIKQGKSIYDKLEDRFKRGRVDYKMQDLVGVRVVVYFKEDIKICEKIIQEHFDVLDMVKDYEETEKFGPQRINYVCRLPEVILNSFESSVWTYPFDKTFEIQIRTIFSEGWHEVEHDFRYKCKDDWDSNLDLSRVLNGIFATLDNCDWVISDLIHQMAYRHYKENNWIAMLKNIYMIRLVDDDDMNEIIEYFNSNTRVAKLFLQLDREQFLFQLSDMSRRIPLKMKTVVLLSNLTQIHDATLESMTSEVIKNLV